MSLLISSVCLFLVHQTSFLQQSSEGQHNVEFEGVKILSKSDQDGLRLSSSLTPKLADVHPCVHTMEKE